MREGRAVTHKKSESQTLPAIKVKWSETKSRTHKKRNAKYPFNKLVILF